MSKFAYDSRRGGLKYKSEKLIDHWFNHIQSLCDCLGKIMVSQDKTLTKIKFKLMKKTLLLSVAAISAMGAFAQEGTDITPANYKFNTAKEIPWYFTGDDITTALKDVNIVGGSTNVWSAMDFAKYYNDGLWVLTSGGQNEVQQADFRNAWGLVDFGGDVGQVAYFVGKASGVKDVLNEMCPAKANDWDAMKVDENATAGWQLHMWMDPAKQPIASEAYIHCRIVYNVYAANAAAGAKVWQNIGMSTNSNGLTGWNESASEKFLNNDCCKVYYTDEGEFDGWETDEDENLIWDPHKWVVYEFDFTIPEPDDSGQVYVPYRLRLNAMNGDAWNNYAVFIKEISFTSHDGESLGEGVKYANQEKSDVYFDAVFDQTPTGSGVEAIESVDVNAPVEYYNLQGVKVANPEKGIFVKKQGNKTSKVVVR